jgi:hypothetical protein
VIWKAETYKESTNKRELIREQEWQILEEEAAERCNITAQVNSQESAPYPTMRFTLRRKELTGPLVAADPSPWTSGMGPVP